MFATQCGHTDCVKILIAAKANVEAKNNDGKTALMWATYKGHTECAEILIAAKANVEATDEGGRTALMLATNGGHTDCVKILIAAKANVEAKNKSGKTALVYANEEGKTEIAKILMPAKANLDPTDTAEARRTAMGFFKDAKVKELIGRFKGKLPPPTYYAFLSHMQLEGAHFCARLHDQLELQGVPVWYDKAPDTQRLDMQGMVMGVIQSACICLYLTKSYFTRPWCQFEMLVAFELGVSVVAIQEKGGPFAISWDKLIEGEPRLERHEVVGTLDNSQGNLYKRWVEVNIVKRFKSEMTAAREKRNVPVLKTEAAEQKKKSGNAVDNWTSDEVADWLKKLSIQENIIESFRLIWWMEPFSSNWITRFWRKSLEWNQNSRGLKSLVISRNCNKGHNRLASSSRNVTILIHQSKCSLGADSVLPLSSYADSNCLYMFHCLKASHHAHTRLKL
eukprot:gb/GEZN01006577.1/.p1 GENE.gb/GEZN01006577.1/~~gb/GEZN01006577.1/.p1  ORF type:complete len:474 (+),score=65.65 gb/GEZN01006577.1/:72-1424(+)